MKLLLLPLLLVLTACSDPVHYVTPPTEIVAVYWHEGNKYSVTTKQGDVLANVRVTWKSTVHVALIADVLPNEPMWYECNYIHNPNNGRATGDGCAIHIRSINDLTGASWNHGKFGSGTTKRIN